MWRRIYPFSSTKRSPKGVTIPQMNILPYIYVTWWYLWGIYLKWQNKSDYCLCKKCPFKPFLFYLWDARKRGSLPCLELIFFMLTKVHQLVASSRPCETYYKSQWSILSNPVVVIIRHYWSWQRVYRFIFLWICRIIEYSSIGEELYNWRELECKI